MSDFKIDELSLNLPIPARFSWRENPDAKDVVVLLHGYQERAEIMSRYVLPHVPETSSVLIPNAPFPVPIMSDKGIKEAYGWYFYDTKTQTMHLSPDTAISMTVQILVRLKATNLPIRLVGFSQGGYFALILGQRLPNVRQVIALSAGFPERYVRVQPSFRIDAVHGTNDVICRYDDAKKEHAELVKKGWSGSFTSLQGSAHRIDQAMQTEVARLLRLPLPVLN